MKEIVILSGKGGTGKTSLTAAFAHLSDNLVVCDADVDAADFHLLAHPDIIEQHDFVAGNAAVIDRDKCTECGTCIDVCRFEAVSNEFFINEITCEGCGVCVKFCPEQIIGFPEKRCGEWYISDSRFGPLVHARLGIAEENSGKLVALVRKEARFLAEKTKADILLTDGPPGIGCPVIASLSGADAVILIVEPTVSGVHDMKRVAELALHFRVPCMLSINKYDINAELTSNIEQTSEEMGIEVLGKIPFDPVFIRSMAVGKNIFEYGEHSVTLDAVQSVWEKAMASSQLKEPKKIIL